MSRSEDPTLVNLETAASASGEIISMTGDSIEIQGIFTPGQALVLRPGARVFVLAVDDAIEILDGLTADAAAEAAAAAAAKAAHEVAKAVATAAGQAVEKIQAGLE
ncbi:hypothetical protein NJBCHELONAE_39350 [Mycobacteroides chelonae]|uniref:hypothetical protein n=1 Tax=Mycobacteroides chelonae TaxID=1774 RepID=UPI0021DEE900|nr:hypothetical protein [Mycobacteroides chelonae]GLE58625.1 hypothetical protein NJBCHELONAE_39350 [Mycobacteroides chelonae]